MAGLTWLNIEFGRREYLRRFLEGEAYEVLALARESHLEQVALSGFGDVVGRASRLHARAQALSASWSTGFMATAEGVGLSFTERFPGAGALEPAPITGFFAFPLTTSVPQPPRPDSTTCSTTAGTSSSTLATLRHLQVT